MSAVNPVNWFEVPVSDLARAKSFYESILGMELTESGMGPNKMAWFPLEQGAAGAAGTLIQGDACRLDPVAAYELTVQRMGSTSSNLPIEL